VHCDQIVFFPGLWFFSHTYSHKPRIVIPRVLLLLFKTIDMQVVKICREHFDFVLPSLQLDRRRRSFVGSPVTTDLIKFFSLMFICGQLLA